MQTGQPGQPADIDLPDQKGHADVNLKCKDDEVPLSSTWYFVKADGSGDPYPNEIGATVLGSWLDAGQSWTTRIFFHAPERDAKVRFYLWCARYEAGGMLSPDTPVVDHGEQQLRLATDQSRCLEEGGPGQDLRVEPCDTSKATQRWSLEGGMIRSDGGLCASTDPGTNEVLQYPKTAPCEGDDPNGWKAWTYDEATNRILSNSIKNTNWCLAELYTLPTLLQTCPSDGTERWIAVTPL